MSLDGPTSEWKNGLSNEILEKIEELESRYLEAVKECNAMAAVEKLSIAEFSQAKVDKIKADILLEEVTEKSIKKEQELDEMIENLRKSLESSSSKSDSLENVLMEKILINDKFVNLESSHFQLQSELECKKIEIHELEQNSSNLNELLNSSKTNLMNVTNELNKIIKMNKNYEFEIKDLKEENDCLFSSCEMVDDCKAAQSKEKIEMQKKLGDTLDKVKNLENKLADAQRDMSVIKETTNMIEMENCNYRREVKETKEGLLAKDEIIEKLRRDIGDKEKAIQQFETKIKNHKEEVISLERKYEREKEGYNKFMESMQEEADRSINESSEYEFHYNILMETNRSLNDTLEEMTAKMTVDSNLCSETENSLWAMKNENITLKKELSKAKWEMIEFKMKYEEEMFKGGELQTKVNMLLISNARLNAVEHFGESIDEDILERFDSCNKKFAKLQFQLEKNKHKNFELEKSNLLLDEKIIKLNEINNQNEKDNASKFESLGSEIKKQKLELDGRMLEEKNVNLTESLTLFKEKEKKIVLLEKKYDELKKQSELSKADSEQLRSQVKLQADLENTIKLANSQLTNSQQSSSEIREELNRKIEKLVNKLSQVEDQFKQCANVFSENARLKKSCKELENELNKKSDLCAACKVNVEQCGDVSQIAMKQQSALCGVKCSHKCTESDQVRRSMEAKIIELESQITELRKAETVDSEKNNTRRISLKRNRMDSDSQDSISSVENRSVSTATTPYRPSIRSQELGMLNEEMSHANDLLSSQNDLLLQKNQQMFVNEEELNNRLFELRNRYSEIKCENNALSQKLCEAMKKSCQIAEIEKEKNEILQDNKRLVAENANIYIMINDLKKNVSKLEDAVKGGDGDNSEIIEKDFEIDSLKKTLDEMEKKCVIERREYSKSIFELTSSNDDLLVKIESMLEKQKESDLKVEELEAEKSRVSEECLKANQHVGELTAEINSLKESLMVLENDAKSYLVKMDSQRDELTLRVKEMEGKIDLMSEEKQKNERSVSDMKLELDKKLKASNNQIKEKDEKIQLFASDIEKSLAENTELKETMEKLNGKIDELEKESVEAGIRNEKLSGSLKLSTSRCERLINELKSSDAVIDRLKTDLAQSKPSTEKAEIESSKYEQVLKENSKLVNENNVLSSQKQKIFEENRELKVKNAAYITEIEKFKADILEKNSEYEKLLKDTNEKRDLLMKSIDNLTSELQTTKEKLTIMSKELDELKQLKEIEGLYKKQGKKIDEINNEKNVLLEENIKLNLLTGDLGSKIDGLNSQNEKSLSDIEKFKTEVDDLKCKVKELPYLQSEMTSLKDELSKMTNERDSANLKINKFKESKGENESLIATNLKLKLKVQEIQSQILDIQTKLLKTEENLSSSENEKRELDLKINALNKQIIENDKELHLKDDRIAGIQNESLSCRREIQNEKDTLASIKSKFAVTSAAMKKKDKELSTLNIERERLKIKLKSTDEKVSLIEKSISTYENKLTLKSELIEKKDEVIENMGKESSIKIATLERKNEQLLVQNRRLQSEIFKDSSRKGILKADLPKSDNNDIVEGKARKSDAGNLNIVIKRVAGDGKVDNFVTTKSPKSQASEDLFDSSCNYEGECKFSLKSDVDTSFISSEASIRGKRKKNKSKTKSKSDELRNLDGEDSQSSFGDDVIGSSHPGNDGGLLKKVDIESTKPAKKSRGRKKAGKRKRGSTVTDDDNNDSNNEIVPSIGEQSLILMESNNCSSVENIASSQPPIISEINKRAKLDDPFDGFGEKSKSEIVVPIKPHCLEIVTPIEPLSVLQVRASSSGSSRRSPRNLNQHVVHETLLSRKNRKKKMSSQDDSDSVAEFSTMNRMKVSDLMEMVEGTSNIPQKSESSVLKVKGAPSSSKRRKQ